MDDYEKAIEDLAGRLSEAERKKRAATIESIRHTCPKCKEQSLHVQGRRGRDDYGEIEGEVEWCEKCGHMDEWASRC